MIPKPTHKEQRSADMRPMVSQLRRFTPNCGYAEVEVVEHVGSWHRPGDVVLMDPDEYARGRIIRPTAAEIDRRERTHKEKPDGRNAGRKNESKNLKAAR